MAWNRRGFAAGAVVGLGVAAAAAAGTGVKWPGAAEAESRPALIRTSLATTPVFAPPPGAPLSFADIFERVAPAVVSIDVKSRLNARQLRQIPGLEGFPFALPSPGGRSTPRGGTGRGGAGPGGQPTPEDLPETEASGSGFFISPDGYVVTNNHVIENATSITIKLNDKRELPARVIGRDELSDLAVLKVDGARFPFVNFENQARPRVGDWVLAVGNPFSLGGTATSGIVSAYGRDIGDQFVDFIQIDAAINRGNSGGPTFDVYGRVIGVNTAIFSPSGGSVGIGFAVPADVADNITRQLISGKTIQRGYLGVAIQDLTKDISESLGVQANSGALIGDVTAGGPAERAGVQAGDIVVSVNGRPITNRNELSRATAATRPGEALALGVLRNGRPLQLQARAGLRPSTAQLEGSNDNEERRGGGSGVAPVAPGPLGLSLAPLNEETRRTYQVQGPVRGVVVTGVESGVDASRKLQRGDVITRANERPIATPADLTAAVADARRANRPSILLYVSRDGRSAAVTVKLNK